MSSLSAKSVVKLHTYSSQQESTTSATEASLASQSLPANLISDTGQLVRVSCSGYADTAGGTAVIKFGSATLASVSVSTSKAFRMRASVLRISDSAQVATVEVNNDGTVTCARVSCSEDLTAAVLIDFRGSAVASGTFYINEAAVEIFV